MPQIPAAPAARSSNCAKRRGVRWPLRPEDGNSHGLSGAPGLRRASRTAS